MNARICSGVGHGVRCVVRARAGNGRTSEVAQGVFKILQLGCALRGLNVCRHVVDDILRALGNPRERRGRGKERASTVVSRVDQH